MQVFGDNMPVAYGVQTLVLPACFQCRNYGVIKDIPLCKGVAWAILLVYHLSWFDMDRFLHLQVTFTIFELCLCYYCLINDNIYDERTQQSRAAESNWS